MSKEDRVEAFFKMANNCVEKEGATTEDLEEILSRKIPRSRAGSCIPACLSETLGIVRMNITEDRRNSSDFDHFNLILDEKQSSGCGKYCCIGR